jgi:hypothetical protein
MLSEVIAGVLVEVITGTGRRLGATFLAASDRRRHGADLAIARWFDTYRLTGEPPDLPNLSDTMEERLVKILRGYEVQAVLHELLAARLTDAPEADVELIRTTFDLTIRSADSELGAALLG